MTIKKISVFCGAHLGKSPDYQIAAEQIGKMMAEKDLEVIFGGGNVGLMKVVADTAVENGGRATGITLKSLHEFELTNPNIDETIITHSLFERKEKFLDMSDAFIVFAYFVVNPIILSFFISAAPDSIQVMTDINKYLDFVLKLFFAFGFAFEIPIATFLIITTGLISKDRIKSMRPYLIISFFVIGMFLTPPDIFSQLFLAIPMWLLFEMGLLISRDPKS